MSDINDKTVSSVVEGFDPLEACHAAAAKRLQARDAFHQAEHKSRMSQHKRPAGDELDAPAERTDSQWSDAFLNSRKRSHARRQDIGL